MTSKPSRRRRRGARRVRNVPLVTVPVFSSEHRALGARENSYQLPMSARVRSALIGRAPRRDQLGSGGPAAPRRARGPAGREAARRAGRSRSPCVAYGAGQDLVSRASWGGLVGGDPLSQQPALGEHQLASDAAGIMSASCCQLAWGSDQAWIRRQALGVGVTQGLQRRRPVGQALHALPGASRTGRIVVHDLCRELVVALAEHRRAHGASARRRSPSRAVDRGRRRGRRPSLGCDRPCPPHLRTRPRHASRPLRRPPLGTLGSRTR
jgi:hypothetical protein